MPLSPSVIVYFVNSDTVSVCHDVQDADYVVSQARTPTDVGEEGGIDIVTYSHKATRVQIH